MISIQQYEQAKIAAAKRIAEAGIVITDAEKNKVEVADFGLGNLEAEGAQILTFFATERIAAKVIVLLPRQTLPEHWHPPVGADPGKEETVRMIAGTMSCCVPGVDTLRCASVPPGKEACYTGRHEMVLKPGEQVTLTPGTKHWFQAGERGAVLYSFSTCVRDILDQFSDPAVERATKVY